MALFDNTSFRLLQQGLDALSYKSDVIRHNLANDSTPGYKTKNVDFGLILEQQRCQCAYHTPVQPRLSSKDWNLTVTTTTETGTNMTKDGNNVDGDLESMKLADTQYQYEQLLNKLNNEFSMISLALSK